jgi:hypothetical protein
MVKFRFAILKGSEKRRTAYLRDEWFSTEQHNTRSILLRVCEDLREIQIVCQKYIDKFAGVVADFGVLGGIAAD